MNQAYLQKTIIGILILAGVLFAYTQFIVSYTSSITGPLDSMLMGFPVVMATVVYLISNYLNTKFNK